MKTFVSTVLLTSTFLAGYPMAALAQDSATTVSDDFQLEDIVVTARRREENLQDTPISISAFSGKTLEAMNVREISKIAQFTPGLELVPNGQSSGVAASIRGISSNEPILTNEPSVGIYIDGIYVNSLSYGAFDTLDLERVEVLRGPQGTLFGRNTTGGSINITTRKPEKNFGMETKLSYATFNELISRSRIDTGEIIPGWQASLTYQFRKADGYVNDITRPDRLDPGAARSHALRAALHGEIGNLALDYTFDMVRRRDVVPQNQFAIASAAYGQFFAQSAANGGDPFRVSTSRLKDVNVPDFPAARARTSNHAATLAYEVSQALTFKSITGYRKYQSSETNPFGSSSGLVVPLLGSGLQSVNPYIGGGLRTVKQLSQELQVLGAVDRLTYTVGGFFYDSKYAENNGQSYVFVLSPTTAARAAGRLAYQGRTRSYALFGQSSYTPPIFDDNLEVTIGLRYTVDKKKLSTQIYKNDLPPPIESFRSKDFKNASYNITLNYKLATDISAYGRYGTGYRAGGFTPRGFDAPAYDPEKARAIEFGLKSEFFDRRLRANFAIYRTDYKDFQIAQPAFSQTAGFVSNIVNAGKAVYQGFEVQFTAIPVRGLTLTADAAYVDPQYKKLIIAGVDEKDNAKFGYVNKTGMHAGGRYEFPPFANGAILSGSLDYSYKSGRVFQPLTSDPVGLPNARDRLAGGPRNELSGRISLSDIKIGPTTVQLSLFGENLLDATYIVSSIDFGALGFGTSQYNRPRVIGIEGKMNF